MRPLGSPNAANRHGLIRLFGGYSADPASMSAAFGLAPNPPDTGVGVGRMLQLVGLVGGQAGAGRIMVSQAREAEIGPGIARFRRVLDRLFQDRFGVARPVRGQ